MAVRVSLLLRRGSGESLTPSALLNSGFETDEPHLLLPRGAAEKLFPQFPAGTTAATIGTAGGDAEILVPSDRVFARIVTGDRESREVAVRVFISEEESEILVSDTAIDALDVEIKSPGKGLWRFAAEDQVRDSVAPQAW